MSEQALSQQLVAWRHHLHRHPETGFEEVNTAAFVAGEPGAMSGQGCHVRVVKGAASEMAPAWSPLRMSGTWWRCLMHYGFSMAIGLWMAIAAAVFIASCATLPCGQRWPQTTHFIRKPHGHHPETV